MNEHVAIKMPAAGYEADVYAWTRAQAELLRAGRLDLIDIDNITEEIESLGREQRHAIESFLVVALEHLTKLAVSGDQDPRRVWQRSVANARGEIERRLRDSPSLRRQMTRMFSQAWPHARRQARLGLRDFEMSRVPEDAPVTLAQTIDPDFFPGD